MNEKSLLRNCTHKMRMKEKYQKNDIYLQKKDNKLLMNQDQYNNIIMECQKLIIFLDNTPNQLSKFRTKNWIEINYQSRGVFNLNSDIRVKTTILKSSLCDYIDAYILVKRRITITGSGAGGAARRADERDKGIILKNCAPFINCKNKINNTDIDTAKGIDVVMPMYNLIEYNDNCSKTSGSLWQYYTDEPNDNLSDSESFKSKIKITGNTPADCNIKNVEIIVPLKYLNNFLRTLEMPLINCEVNLNFNSTGDRKFVITDTKLYVPAVTFSTQDNPNCFSN